MEAESGSNPTDSGKAALSPSRYPKVGETGKTVTRVLLGEDNTADVGLIREALTHHGFEAEVTVHRDGEEMLRWIAALDAGEMPCPDIVLLDLNLPRFDGFAILKRLRQSPMCGHVPVVIVTSSGAATDRDAAARLGATSYFRKPLDFDEFLLLGALVKQILTSSAQGAD